MISGEMLLDFAALFFLGVVAGAVLSFCVFSLWVTVGVVGTAFLRLLDSPSWEGGDSDDSDDDFSSGIEDLSDDCLTTSASGAIWHTNPNTGSSEGYTSLGYRVW